MNLPASDGDIGRRWQPGEAVVLRYLTRDGRPGMSWPALAVEDREDLLALFIPEGAIYKLWGVTRPDDGSPPLRVLVDSPWRRDTLRLMFPGRSHSVWLSWDRTPAGREFHGYYINMEEPYRRSLIGVDTDDHALDVVVAPDLSWTWKDAEELQARAESGTYHRDFVARVRDDAERVVEALEARLPPFSGEWVEWLPDAAWALPRLPQDWDTAPPVLWPDRHLAYADAGAPRA